MYTVKITNKLFLKHVLLHIWVSSQHDHPLCYSCYTDDYVLGQNKETTKHTHNGSVNMSDCEGGQMTAELWQREVITGESVVPEAENKTFQKVTYQNRESQSLLPTCRTSN